MVFYLVSKSPNSVDMTFFVNKELGWSNLKT
jgi:hypothetical protein